MKTSEILVAGSKYRVCAFDKMNGRQLWETELQTGFFKWGGPFVSIALDETGIYAHAGNHFYRLDWLTGAILWKQKVPSMGTEVSSLGLLGGISSDVNSAFARISAQRQAQQNAGDGGAA